MPRLLLPLCAAALVLTLGGCASQLQGSDKLLGVLTPYRMDIVQGNVVTKEQLALLRVGMTRRQVGDVLGTPLINDIFHADRWDYPFTIRRQGTEPQRRSVVVHFKGDVLERIDAPELPTEREFISAISRSHRKFEPRVLELTEAQRNALPPPPARATTTSEPTGPVREYPPLESPS